MIKQLIQKFPTTLFLSSLLVLSACGGGGGNTDDGPPATPIGDISGFWNVETVVNREDCGGGSAEVDPDEIVSVTQSGSSVTVTDSDGPNTGTLSGNRLSWSGSYPEDGGTTSVSFSLTVAADCNSLSGTAPWSWTDGTFTCSGTTQVNATRLDPVGCGGGSGGGGGGGGGGTTIAEAEPNDTPATAQAITLPVTITGATQGDFTPGGPESGDVDFFSFTLTSTQTVTATLTGGTTTDMDLYITLTDGQTVIYRSEDDFSNEMVSGPLDAGTYLVGINPWDVPTTTSYSLSIQ